MNIEQLKEKHLEIIELYMEGNYLFGSINRNKLSDTCAQISEHYGKIQRLEGMIEGFNVGFYFPSQQEYKIKLKELEQRLEKLKNEL